MPKINEATNTDLKVIEALQEIEWKRGDTLLYQPEYRLLLKTGHQPKLRKRDLLPDAGNIQNMIHLKYIHV